MRRTQRLMNSVKSHWRRADKPVSLKQWARYMHKEKGDVGVFCGRWLKNKGPHGPSFLRQR